MSTVKLYLKRYRSLLVVGGIAIGALPLLFVAEEKGRCGYVMVMMAACWISEIVPIAITALLPVFFLPVLGLVPAKTVASKYIKDSTLMFSGGLILATAVEKVNLHRHLSLNFLLFVGQQPNRLILGFGLIGWFLSMWISNTATIAMLLPCVEAVLETLQSSSSTAQHLLTEESTPDGRGNTELQEIVLDANSKDQEAEQELEYKGSDASNKRFRNLAKALTLATVYCSKTGGMATLTGTTPTVIMKGIVDEWWISRGLDEGPITFPNWMVVGAPISFLILVSILLWLMVFYFGIRETFRPSSSKMENVRAVILQDREKLGRFQFQQGVVLFLFALLVGLWFFRAPGFMPGWASSLKPGYITDAIPAIIVPFFLFIIPQDLSPTAAPILDWKTVHEKFPWLIIWLMGGGFALADASIKSGLSTWFGSQLMIFSGLPLWAMLGSICLIVSFLTEVTSNSATVTLLMPILASFAETLRINPLHMMWPVTLAAEFAFMLPSSASSSALALTTGRVSVSDMIKSGFILNIIGVVYVIIAAHSWGWVYFQHGVLPYELPTHGNNVTASIELRANSTG